MLHIFISVILMYVIGMYCNTLFKVLVSNSLTEKQEDALDKTIFVPGGTHDLPREVNTKVQVGYGIAKSVIEFINSKFIR